MIETDPLHVEPTRPIGGPPIVELRDRHPIRYEGLLPSTTYVSIGFGYLTDAAAMPARVRGSLRLVSSSDRIRHDTAQRGVGGRGDGTDDQYHGGHIVAVSLSRFASGPSLFPQAANFNLSAFARLEHSWRQALREGCTVEVDIALAEGDESDTPSFVIVTHWEDGFEETLTFINEGHSQ